MPGEPVGPTSDPNLGGDAFPITEVFVQYGNQQLVQLTSFSRVDTFAGLLTHDGKRAVFMSSADPLPGTNPDGNCQLFSVNVRGGGLRQITHLKGRPATSPEIAPCHLPNGIGYGAYR